MRYLKTVIIDDEQDSVELLSLQLSKYCPHVQLLKAFTSSEQACMELPDLYPELVILDIEMPEMTGFQLLERLMPLSFHVIFITAYNQYAIKAFRFNAIDYLIKPIDTTQLIEAVSRVYYQAKPSSDNISLLQRQISGELPIQKIALSSQSGISFLELRDIIYVEANGNYSVIHRQSDTPFIVTRTLKDIQEVLEQSHFLRIHRQYLVNLNMVTHFNRIESILSIEGGKQLPVARTLKDKLMERFAGLY